MSTLVLLGPQRHRITVGEAIKELELDGPFAAITAGWQERELEVEELDASLGQKSINLRLHQRSETIFREVPAFREEHRAHQTRLRRRQELYRLRLKFYMDTVRKLAAQADQNPSELIETELELAMQVVRELDRHHLQSIRELHHQFREQWDMQRHPVIADHQLELSEILDRCSAVIIAGGHVAVLLNRLRLLNLEPFLQRMPVIAWSAGAMCLGQQVVLFHDTPPQGQGYAEVFETGLGIHQGILPLPHAEKRLLLNDRQRVSIFARRFTGWDCLTFGTESRLDIIDDERAALGNVRCLKEDGSVEAMEDA